jgi:Spy/CpxP family protein refolding chaperone
MRKNPAPYTLVMLSLCVLIGPPALASQRALDAAIAVHESPVAQAQQPTTAARGRGREWEWWKTPADRSLLGLTDDQTKRIDRIYRSYEEVSGPYSSDLNQQRETLETMARERLVSDGEFAVQLSRVSALQSRLWQERSLMLYKISRVLTTEQNVKLKDLQALRTKKGEQR